MKRTLFVALFAAVALFPATSRASTLTCNAGANVAVVASNADDAAVGPTCTTTLTCPSSHSGNCTFTAKGSATGTGAIGVRMVFNSTTKTCGPAVNTCTTPTASQSVAPGQSRSAACDLYNAAAALVTLDCTISYP